MDLAPGSPAHRAAARLGPRRRVASLAAVVGITAVLTALLLEGGLRLFAPQYGPEMLRAALSGLYIPDPAAGYRNAPGAHVVYDYGELHAVYDINAQGLREDAAIGPAPAGTMRLLVLGDSFAFGWGVPATQTFPRLLAGSHAAGGDPVEPLNAGVDGYGTDNEAAWLATYGWALQPRLVLVAFFVGNDVRDVMLGIHKTYVDPQDGLEPDGSARVAVGLPAAEGTPLGAAKGWLALHSQAYVLLRALAHGLASAVAPDTAPAQPGLADAAPFYYATPSPEIEAGWAKTLGVLDGIRAAATARGAEVVVVAIPTREQVEDTYWQAMKGRFGLQDSALVRDAPQRRLAVWSRETGTPLIDLLPGFRAAGPTPRYFRTDPHWNAAGYALAAQLIHDGLVRLGLFRP